MTTSHRTAKAGLALAAMLLAVGCVPLDTATPEPASGSLASSPAGVPRTGGGWEDCADPVIESRTAVNDGWKIITAVEMDTTSGSESHRVLLDENIDVSLSFDTVVPGAERFTTRIGEALGYPTTGSLNGLDVVLDTLGSIEEPSTTLGYRAVEQLSVPFTLVCGNQVSTGIAHTWNHTETGIIDCSLAATDEQHGFAVDLARTTYCPTD